MMNCTYRLSLNELLNRPAAELRLVGADDDDDDKSSQQSQQNGSDDDDKSDDDAGGGDDGDKKGSGGSAGTPDAKDRRIAGLEEERQRHYDLRKEAETKLEAAEAEIARLKKDGTTDDETKQNLVRLERENADLKVKNSDLALENAFLKSNSHKWRDNEAALKLADLSKVELDDKTGQVHGLQDALDRLAANSPWLLADDSQGKSEKDEKPKRKTGDAPGSQRSGSQSDKEAQAQKARLQSKYPGLRR